MSIKDNSGYKAARFCLILFSFFTICSFLYALITQRYNGDFMGTHVDLPLWTLVLNLVLTLAPYFFTWILYKKFKKSEVTRAITIPIQFFGVFLIFIIIWNILVTLAFGVGVLGAPLYEAPIFIKPFIQILNRFHYVYGGMLYILVSGKRNRTQFLIVFLLIILAYLRAGLGIFLYFGLTFSIKYFDEMWKVIKEKLLVAVIVLFTFPILVGLLYDLRSALRNSDEQATSLTSKDLIFGKLIGRLSSFSNSAMILQEAPYFFYNAQSLSPYYFQQQAIGGMISVNLMPKLYPENLLINVFGGDSEYVSYMVGTQGGWYIAAMKSLNVLMLNLFTVLVCVLLTFYFFRFMRFENANEYAFMLVLYPLTSGVANEYSQLVLSTLIYIVLFLLVNYYQSKTLRVENPKLRN